MVVLGGLVVDVLGLGVVSGSLLTTVVVSGLGVVVEGGEGVGEGGDGAWVVGGEGASENC